MSGAFDPYHRWLGIPVGEQPPNHYRLLGLQCFEQDADVIEAAADQRTAGLRLYLDGKHAAQAQTLLKELSEAKVCLLLPERKQVYDQWLREQLKARSQSDVGSQLAEYLLEEKLGEGGMGVVYRARHVKLGRMVAVKILAKGRVEDRQAIARFEREISAIGRVDHPNIVRALDAREVGGTRFLVMEFVEGLHLGDILRRCCPLAIADATHLVCQTAAGLQAAHEHGLVHRDIKPSNLMLTANGLVKVLDLGLVRFSSASDERNEEVTASGQAMGTIDYMAPEQIADSRHVDIRADIYSLGCTCYKLLTGKAPFAGSDYAGTLDKLMARVQRDPRPIEEMRADIPRKLAAIIGRMLAREPQDRFATPAELVTALTPWTSGSDLPGLLARAKLIDPAQLPPEMRTPARGECCSPASGEGVAPVLVEAWGSWTVWLKTALAATALLLLVGLLVSYFSGPPERTAAPRPAAEKPAAAKPHAEERPAETPQATVEAAKPNPEAKPAPKRPVILVSPEVPARIKIQKPLEEAGRLPRAAAVGGK